MLKPIVNKLVFFIKPYSEHGDAPMLLPKVARTQILFTIFITVLSSLLIYIPGFPFDKRFGLIAIISGLIHTTLFIYYKKIKYAHLVTVHLFNIVLLGFAVHFSGGIVSPFVGVFACVLIAGIASEVHHPIVLPVTVAVYISVIALEYFKKIQPKLISATDIYQSAWTTLFIVVAIVGFLIICGKFYDVVIKNARTKIEAEQVQKQQLLKKMGNLEASSHLGMMVAKIAHDINGPLTAIGGFLQIMQDDDSFSTKAREDLNVMFRETKRISAMIDKMLKYVKPGTETKEPICPKDVVETVMTVLQFHPLAKGIQFVKNYQLRDGVRVIGNKQSLQQVYFNIAKNALEAMSGCKGKKVVTVSLTHDPEKCYVNIADNGPGMSEDILEKVKQGFFTTKEGGTGLGLTVTKEIIDGHQGNFGIESEPGKGTKILTSIPIYNPTAPVVLPSPSVESVA